METNQVNTQELEYKYKADEVKISDFLKLMTKLGWKSKLDVSSWDIYYTDSEDEKFLRFRNGSNPELTRKQKVVKHNNWERIEVDLPLDEARLSEGLVSQFVALGGYTENFRIYKTCFIYWFDDVNYVYYIVYNENMKEVGRFIEVEVNKEIAHKVGEKEFDGVTGEEFTYNPLDDAAKYLEELGLTHRNRMKRSLFEIYRKTS